MAGRIILGIANPALDADGEVDSGATLTFYKNGTTTLQSIYSDSTLTTPLENPLSCDASGRFSQIWAPSNVAYSIKWAPTGAAAITYDNITADPGAAIKSIGSTATLLTMFGSPNALADGDTFITSGRDAAGDGGGGTFYYDATDTTTTDNGGTVRVDGQSRRFKYVSPGFVTPQLFGATFASNAADNDTPVQNLLDSGENIFFAGKGTMEVSTLKTIGRSNVRITFAAGFVLKQTGSNADSTLFYATGQTNITIEGGVLTPGGTQASMTQGWAIHFLNCTNCWAVRNEITAHRRGGVLINGCTDSGWIDPWCHDSIVDPAVDDHTTAGTDCLIANGCTNCHGIGGRSRDGAGIAFAIQTIDSNSGAGYTVKNCSLKVTSVINAPMYGVMVYKLNSNDVWADISLDVGLIDTVTGAVPHSTEGYVYGTGIYIQGIEGVNLRYDTIRNTNVNTGVETLAPGAIGVANCRSVNINGGFIESPNWYGVCLFDPNAQGDATSGAGAVVLFNEIRGAVKTAVYCKDFPVARVSGKVIGGNDAGFASANAATTSAKRYDLRDFIADGTAGVCIQAAVGDLYISGGYSKCSATSNFAVAKNTSGGVYIENYHLDGASAVVWPLDIQGTPGRCAFGPGVKITANASGANAGKVARLAAPVRNIETAILENNAASGGAAAWPGDYKLINTLTDAASPTVTDMKLVQTGGTTTITGFTGMEEGQELELLSQHTVTLTHSGTFYLAGAANKSLVAGNTIIFRMSDGVIRQIGALAA